MFSKPFDRSRVLDEINVVLADLGLELFYSRASAKRVPEVDLVEETSKGTAFWEGGVVDNNLVC